MKNLQIILMMAFVIAIASNKCTAQWIPVYQDANAHFIDAAFPTNYTGFVAASDSGGTVVLQTNDGGMTWNKKYIIGQIPYEKIAMIDSLTGYLIRGGVPVQILKTNDGFSTYTLHNLDTSYTVQAFELLNDSTGLYLNNETRLRKFKHNGTSYNYVIDTLFAGQNLQFVNSQKGFLDNGDRLLMTNDEGATWNYVNTSLGFYCVAFKFADSLNGYFHDGSEIYKTSDGGSTFTQQFIFPNASCIAAEREFCMVSNYSGDVAYTTDSGLTWLTETTGINSIVSESYVIKNTPDRSCFLFSRNSGEIRKRQPVIANVSDLPNDDGSSIYPNPFSSQTTISFSEEQTNTKIRITDALGEEISIENISGKQFSFDREKLPAGIYCVTIISKNRIITNKKIVIQ